MVDAATGRDRRKTDRPEADPGATRRVMWWLRRRHNLLSTLVLVPLLIPAGMFSYWAMDPILYGPPQRMLYLEPEFDRLEPGQPLRLNWAIATDRLCPVTLTRWLQNGETHVWPSHSGSINETGVKVSSSVIQLPDLSPGAYNFFLRAEYRCNPVAVYTKVRGPIRFTIEDTAP